MPPEDQRKPIPILSLDATISLWSTLFSIKYQDDNTLHHFHIHVGGGDMAGVPPIYNGYMFTKNGKGHGRQENLTSIMKTYNRGIERERSNLTTKQERIHIIMIPGRIWDASFAEEELGAVSELPNRIVRERERAQSSLETIKLVLNGNHELTDEELKSLVPIARKAYNKDTNRITYMQKAVETLENPTYPFNIQLMQKENLKWALQRACGDDGTLANKMWKKAVNEGEWKPAADAVRNALPPHFTKRISNHLPTQFNDNCEIDPNDILAKDLHFALNDLSIPLASLLVASLRNLMEK